MHKPNNLLESDVKSELDWDPALDSAQVIVKADEGVVILTGAVPSYYDSLVASDDAWSVGGVKAVDNELLVGFAGEAIADADVAADCVAALDGNRLVPAGAVSVAVFDGWVTLSGTLRRHFQRQAATHSVSRVAGVRGVTDNIVLAGDPVPSDVAERINEAFRRNAIIDDSLIEVSSSGHTIYLDGSTSSWASMDEAVDTAWQAPGVTEVVNRLVIIP